MIRRAFLVLRVVVPVCALGLLIWQTDLGVTWDALRSTPWIVPLAGPGLMASSQLLVARRLQLLMNARGHDLSYAQSVRLTMLGLFAGNFLPSSAGGDAVKLVVLARRGYGVARVTSVLVADRTLNLVALALLLPCAATLPALVGWRVPTALLLLAAITAASLVLIALAVYLYRGFVGRLLMRTFGRVRLGQRPRSALAEARETFGVFLSNRVLIVWCIGLSVPSVLLIILGAYAAILGVGGTIGFIQLIGVVVLVSVANLLPISFNGLGVQEFTVVAMLSALGIGHAQAVAVSILMRYFYLSVSLLGGLELLSAPKLRRSVSAEP